MNRNTIIYEENADGNEKKKRKLFEDTPNFDSNFFSNYLTEYNVDHVNFSRVSSNQISSNQINCNQSNHVLDSTYQNSKETNYCDNFYPNDNSFNIYKQNKKDDPLLGFNNNCNNNIQFDKNLLINSIDVLLNFMNYNYLNETIKHEALHENLLNLRFYILSLNDDKFIQKKITEYFLKM
ncbi:conserved Plasmodium protein, unknown function [Plasmodium malariae]|uniref:Uncharacterized protein n=1 Tax=Plasmodium malariae TaxID=5858 RepID=A0A1C3L0B2_PLAMA|nr:conserved Plasmodium protein, unknown function [Plasmodium malariae]